MSSIADALTARWVWLPDWQDLDLSGSAGRLVDFRREFDLPEQAACRIFLTADTRYKLVVNGHRVSLGPGRGSPQHWLYDEIDICPWLKRGPNTIVVTVMRWFKTVRGGLPFVRADLPGFTLMGHAGDIDLSSDKGWLARARNDVTFPTGLVDDVFLHINERVTDTAVGGWVSPVLLDIRTVNGELALWTLYPRTFPLPEQTVSPVAAVHNVNSPASWATALLDGGPLELPAGQHTVDVVASTHSTAFVRLALKSTSPASVSLKLIYSEGYEDEPRQYPWLRTKSDRADPSKYLLGPFDEVSTTVNTEWTYEPFWFRTFSVIRLSIQNSAPVTLASLSFTQINYPLDVQAEWREGGYGSKMWDISIRTMRNCMLDGYSDCPFYEQLMYSGDSRSVILFHYLVSGDDRLARHALDLFAASFTSLPGGGLTQSRFPSHVPQLIAGFPLYFILSLADHYLYYADRDFAENHLHVAMGILRWFQNHIDDRGLVSGMPSAVWQYVDWVDTWSATNEHPDKGVPTAGRKKNQHTFFSMLLSHTLGKAAWLFDELGYPMGKKYLGLRDRINEGVRRHCFDEETGFFTDAAAWQGHDLPAISQHCQVFAVLCGAADQLDSGDLLRRAFAEQPPFKISKCSYVMLFYAFRAFSQSGLYSELFERMLAPWRRMIDQNMTTWEEDDVRQRSDCHAWGAVPIYEFATEVAGVTPVEPGWKTLRWAPRLDLQKAAEAKICLGKGNTARVVIGADRSASLTLEKAARVTSVSARGEVDHGLVTEVRL